MGKSATGRSVVMVGAIMAVLGFVLVPTACGEKVAEQKIEKEMEKAFEAEGKDVDVDLDDESGSIVITGEDGDSTMSFGETATVPEGFPQGLLPADADIQSAISVGEGGLSMQTVTFATGGSPEEMYEWFLEALPKAGYDIKQKMQFDTGDGMGFNIAGSGAADDCTVNCAGDDGQSVYSVMIATK